MKTPSCYAVRVYGAGLLLLMAATARADLFHSPKFKSPAGKYAVIFASAGETGLPLTRTAGHIPKGQKVQYILLFYVAGTSDPVSANWYTDTDPAPAPETIAAAMLWSPGEQHVVVTHGLRAKATGATHWLVSMKKTTVYGFEGTHLRWVDETRLVGDIQTKKIPGGIMLVQTGRPNSELIISPHAGIGYAIAASTPSQVTVKEYLNHWGEEREKTSWEFFEPACFTVYLNTMKKRSVPCPQ